MVKHGTDADVHERSGESSTPRQRAGYYYRCDFCGTEMVDVHCKLRCTGCGYLRDCSDP